jgi:hypothetical protein
MVNDIALPTANDFLSSLANSSFKFNAPIAAL